MKKPLFALVAAAPFVVAGFSSYQGDEPAEKVFKSILSFKGVPAKEIMPAMKFMNASLKVDCGFCHQENDYAADHPNREVTRKMIDMQRDINEKFFNGRTEVTCNSCHNGLTHPVGVPVLTGVSNQHSRYRTDQTPADLFKKHMAAVGGTGPILKWTGTLKEGDKDAIPFEVFQAPSGQFLATMGPIKMGHDGTTTWTHDGTTVVKLWGDDAISLARMGRSYRNPDAFEGLTRLSIAGREKLGERFALVVRGTLATPGYTEEYYFDQESGLLSRVVAYVRTSIGTVPTYIDYGDYRDVAGVKAPFQITSLSMSGAVTVVQYESAAAEASFDVKRFSPPAG